MVAGRSGSAYTAELGSMKMREEIDALRTMGFDPIEVLILPRMLALIIALPILAFLGAMAALYGGGLVAWLYGGVDPEAFLLRLRDAISIDHFTVGIIKAPVMAAVIGIVACVEGLAVRGQRRIARTAHHVLGGEGDLLRHRDGRRVRDLLRLDRDVTMAPEISDAIIRVRDITVQFGTTQGARRAQSRRQARRNPGLCRSLRRRQIGADAHHHRAGAQDQRPHRGVRDRSRCRRRQGAARRRAALGHPVPAGRAVFLADGAAEHPVSGARISQRLAAAARRDHGGQARHGRACSPKSPTVFPPSSPAA